MQWDADPEEHANESKTSLANRAFRALGIDYRRAGCPAKIDNNEIGVLCTPRRAVLKTATYLSGSLERTSHSTALPFAYLAVFKFAEKIMDIFAYSRNDIALKTDSKASPINIGSVFSSVFALSQLRSLHCAKALGLKFLVKNISCNTVKKLACTADKKRIFCV